MRLFRRFRLLIIGVGCLIAGVVLIVRYYTALPKLEDLRPVTGEVRLELGTRTTRRSQHHYPILVFNDSPNKYKYLDWFPKADDIPTMIRAADTITIWTDRGERNWIWQIERAGQLLV